ncbi:MAG: UDP-3-O-(3-hydroxymyristoyl)glucosamine N-acyltransferase [Myxococcota bacterium]|nr:UDP-3-O-(3-hydroxymyristoyl)glucosamine N-acyltransferase [Myxococcota bacterium]
MIRTLGELASFVGGQLEGQASLEISGVNGLTEAGPSEISFYGNTRYRKDYLATRASAVLVNQDAPARDGLSLVRVPNPHLAFARLSALFHPVRPVSPGVRPGAHVHPDAQVDPSAAVLPGAFVDRHATIGPRAVLHPGAYVGEDASVGEDSILYPNAVLREGCRIGARVIVHPCAVIGADGFGFAFDPEQPQHFKIPQAGVVRVEDDVEIGACTTIDRATLGETVIGQGTKIDNLVQLAHNVRVGPLALICAQAGVSGSTQIGTGAILAGQVGVVGHIRVGDLARVGAGSGVAHDVPDGATVSGAPAMDHKQWLKASAAYGQMADLIKEVRALKKKVEALQQNPQSDASKERA